MNFWKPGQSTPGQSNNATGLGKSKLFDHSNIWISKYKEQVQFLVEKYQTVIICEGFLSIKSTYLPKFLIEGGWTKEGHLIAVSLSNSMQARHIFQNALDVADPSTKDLIILNAALDDYIPKYASLLYTTHEFLIKQVLIDPLLSKYSVIFLEGVSSMVLETDFLMSVLKKILKKRQDLRLVLFGSSSDSDRLFSFFDYTISSSNKSSDNCVILSLDDRRYPIQRLYLSSPCQDYIARVIDTVFKIHTLEGPGDILVFLTGREDIDTVVTLLSDRVVENRFALLTLPLYGGIGSAEYAAVIQPAPIKTRKVIVSTNVAEQENFLEGIVYVIDAGFVKINVYNSNLNMSQLITVPISSLSAERRSQVSGLSRPGKCFHLYTEKDLLMSDNMNLPEIQRSNLLNSILQLKALGIDNIKSFDYINDPGPQSLKNSLEYLCLLSLLSPESGNITALGKQVINCPLTDPLLSTMLLKSIDFECTEEALIIASMMSIGDFCLPGPSGKFEEVKNKFGVNEGDIIAAVNIFQSFLNSRKSSSWCSSNFICYKNIMRAVTVQNRLSKYIKQLGFPIKSCGRDVNLVRKCVASVFFAQISKLSTDGVSYRSLRHQDESFPFYIHHSSCLFGRSPPWILPLKIQETSKPFLFNVTTIDPLWLPDLVPEAFSLGF